MGQFSRVISFRVKDHELEEIHDLMTELGVNSYKGLLLKLIEIYKDCSQKEDLKDFLQRISSQIEKLSEDLKEIKSETIHSVPNTNPTPSNSNSNNWIVIPFLILLGIGILLLAYFLF